METAIKNGGEKNGTIVEHYGDILFMLGQKDQAVEQWEKAFKIGDASKMINEKIKQKRYIENIEK